MVNKEALFTSARTGENKKDNWLTPLWLFDKLNEEFNFKLDAAATRSNTLCDRWYSLEDGDDGLTNPWLDTTFCNPPYSQLKAWVRKGCGEAMLGHCTAVLLVAARTDTRAWWDCIRHGEVRFLKGRLKFEHPDGARYCAPFPSAVVIFHRHTLQARTVYWDIQEPKGETHADSE